MKLKYLIITIISIFCILFLPNNISAKDSSDGKFVIVIDAGHGGHDTGACDNGAREKDINLGVALKLGEMLEKNLKDVKVVYTRNNDTFVSLQGRADIANKAKADLFVSIHTNSLDKNNKNRTSVEGASVYALGLHKDASNMEVARRENSVIELENNYEQKYQGFDPNKDESYIIFEMAQKKNLSKSLNFAKNVQNELVNTAGRKNRGVHQAGFWVLHATSMPAVLIELDFICNPTSTRFMTGNDGQTKLAKSIYNAVNEYVKRNKATTVATSNQGKSSGSNNPSPSKKSSTKSGKNTEKKGNNSKKTKKSTADITTPEKEEVLLAETSNIPVLPSVKSEEKKFHKNEGSSQRTVSGKRRRRSEQSRLVSDSNIKQESSITLLSENEREAVGNFLSESTVAVSKVDTSTTKSASKSKEKKSSKSSKSKHKSKLQRFKTVYSIQVLTSSEVLGSSDPRFHGLSPVMRTKENNIYKYTYGELNTREDAEGELKKIKKDFPDAIIVEELKSTTPPSRK